MADEIKQGQEPQGGTNSDNEGKLYSEDYVASLRKESAKYRSRLRDTEKNLAEMQSKLDGIDLDKYEEMVKREEELQEAQAKKEGDWEALRQKMQDAFNKEAEGYQKKLESESQKAARLEQELHSTILKNTIALEAAKEKAINPDLVNLAISAEARVIIQEDGSRAIRLVDETGEERIDMKTGKPVTVAQRIAEMKQDAKYAHLFEGGHLGGGSGTVFKNGKPDFSKMTVMQRAAWERKQMFANSR